MLGCCLQLLLRLRQGLLLFPTVYSGEAAIELPQSLPSCCRNSAILCVWLCVGPVDLNLGLCAYVAVFYPLSLLSSPKALVISLFLIYFIISTPFQQDFK